MSRVPMLLLLTAMIPCGASFYFRLRSEERCFLEEVSPNVEVMQILYKLKYPATVKDGKEQHENAEGLSSISEANHVRPWTLIVRNADAKEILNRRVGDLSGTISLKTTEGVWGEYEICTISDGSQKQLEQRPHELNLEIHHTNKIRKHLKAPKRETGPGGMEIETFVDEDGTVKETLKSHEELQLIYEELQNMKDIMKELKEEAEYFSSRQTRFGETAVSTFDRVLTTSFVTSLVVVFTSIYQYYHLKNYLLKKKLV
ncbi:Transmembrane emp24 domain-containing protein eca [Diplonema papillatum]|nr:Transmembrane emp24 domain-containing protein eca [Diplonema papillatum]